MKVSICIPCYNEEELVVKCLDSIPERDDVEIIVTEDCSTDNTYQVLQQYVKDHPNKIIKLFHNEENMGHGYSVNVCQDNATGDWLMELGSDDYLFTDSFSMFIDKYLDPKYDLVYFNLIDNEGRIFRSTAGHKYVGAVKFMKRSFIGDMRATPRRNGQDNEFSHMLWNKNPKMFFTNMTLTHWNYPKEGTISWKAQHGEIDDYGNIIKKEDTNEG